LLHCSADGKEKGMKWLLKWLRQLRRVNGESLACQSFLPGEKEMVLSDIEQRSR